jgi:hypothetical protein
MPAPKTLEAIALWKQRMSTAQKGTWTVERKQAYALRIAERNRQSAKPKLEKVARTKEQKSETARANSLKGREARIAFNKTKKGTHWTEKQRQAQIDRLTGRKHSPATREKMSASAIANLGKRGFKAEVPLVSSKQRGGKSFLRSKLEAKFVAWMETNTDVLWFRYELVKVPYYVGGLRKLTVADFLVKTQSTGLVLVEVKPLFAIARSEAKLLAAKNYANLQGWGFGVFSEKSLNGFDTWG